MDPVDLHADETAENTVDHDGGYPVYAGTLQKAGGKQDVHVKVIPLTDAYKASRAWRELVMMLQVTQALGRSVVRTLGYVEQPGEALKIILEADDGSVLQLRQAGRLDCEFGMRLAERVAFALEHLHATHVVHGSICPAALRVAPPDTAAAPAPSAALDTDAAAAGVRVMIGEFSDACAVAPPEYTVPTVHATSGLSVTAEDYAPPERLDRVSGVLRAQTDMYSFAATMYHLLTGMTVRDAEQAPEGAGGGGAVAATPAPPPPASTAPTRPSLNRKLSAGLERMKSLTSSSSMARTGAAAAAAAEADCGAPAEFFALLRECLSGRAERRPCAEEVARRLAYILSEGNITDGKFVYKKGRGPQGVTKHADTTNLKPGRTIGDTMRTIMHMGAAPSASGTDTPGSTARSLGVRPAKRGFRFSSLRDKLMAMVCVANGADTATVQLSRVHGTARTFVPGGGDECELEAFTMPMPDGTPSVTGDAGFSDDTIVDRARTRRTPSGVQAQGQAGDGLGVSTSTVNRPDDDDDDDDDDSPGPKPPTKKAVRTLTPPRGGRYIHENLKSWVSRASSETTAAAAAHGRPLPTGRPTHPLPLDEQASVVLTKLGFPRLAVAMAVKESAGNLEDSLQILLAPQDEVIDRCHRSINREFAKLKAAAEARAADRPGAPRSVVTADLWDWVEEQAGATLDADDVNAVLDRSEGAADDEDVSIAQFTHVVVRMFEQFFRVLDKQGCGYLTQEELREAFFDSSTEDATSKLRSAMEEIDLNSDGGVSLNELLVVGLGRSTSRLSSMTGRTRGTSSQMGPAGGAPHPDTIAEDSEHDSDSDASVVTACDTNSPAPAHPTPASTPPPPAPTGSKPPSTASDTGSAASTSTSEDGGETAQDQLEDMSDALTDQLRRGHTHTHTSSTTATDSEALATQLTYGIAPTDSEGGSVDPPHAGESAAAEGALPVWPPLLPSGAPLVGGKPTATMHMT